MPLTAIADFAEKGKTDPLFKELARLVEKTHGIWNEQAEKYLLAQFGVDIGRPRNDVLAWPLFRVTEQAALAAWPQTGCGDKNKIDGLAVTAMRQALNDVAFRGRVVIGEGKLTMRRCCGLAKRWAKAMGQKSISRSIPLKARGWWRWGRAMRWRSWLSPSR